MSAIENTILSIVLMIGLFANLLNVIWLGIGLNILHYRKEQGLTQIELADKCNISRTYMQKIETAASSCTLDTLIDIAEALNIPLKKLFEFKD